MIQTNYRDDLRSSSPIVWLFVWPLMLGLLVLVSHGC